ncbi:MAG TPA: PadR family transcriptional regulator [Acidimicrobiales bacterium]|nr:PadR family transcriptional regulator [Acidimicrobiales bacterium]
MRDHFLPTDRGPHGGRHRHEFGHWGPPFPPPGFGRGRGRGRGRRGRRGDVRNALLALLAERPMHGYEMIQELAGRTGGIWRPSPGSVYPTLQMLEDEGLVIADSGGARKRYTLTDEGRTAAEPAAAKPPWAEFADDDDVAAAHDVRQAAAGIMNALAEVSMAGTDEQRARALEVLNETKRKLYAILASES